MNYRKTKNGLISIILLLCIISLSSCGLTELFDKNNIRKTMEAIETSIDSRNNSSFKNIFAPTVKQNVHESDIDKIFDIFWLGITYKNTDSENYPATYESKRGDNYTKNLEWHKEVIDNATQKEYVMIINICVENWSEESAIGVKYIILYDIKHKEDALDWFNSIDELEILEGIYIYGE